MPVVQARVLNRLTQAPGAIVSLRELVDHCYGDRKDGGPLTAESVVQHAVAALRRRGFGIANHPGRGYQLVSTRRG